MRYFRNQQRPRLDLNLTYGLNGVGGDITDRDFLTARDLRIPAGRLRRCHRPGQERRFRRLACRSQFCLSDPEPNRGSELGHWPRVGYRRGQAEYQNLELAVVTEVRRVARLLEAQAEAVESAEVSRRLEERNYEAEQKRYDNGMSTSFQVLQIQEDLTEARSVYVAAVAGYRRALALHYQSTGTLIEVSGVSIVGEERAPESEEPEA